MDENNGFILKPEMYSQEEWYKMFMKSIETINNLQSKIGKAIEYTENSTWEDEYGGDIIEDYDHKLLDILKENK